MLQFHVLVHATFGAVGFVAALDGAFIVSLDLSGCSSMPLALVIAMLTAHLIIRNLVIHDWQDMLHGYSDAIIYHFWHAICMYSLTYKVNLVHVVLPKRLDRFPTEYGLLKAAVVCDGAVSSSVATPRLTSTCLLQSLQVVIERIRWCLILIFQTIHQLLSLFYQLLVTIGQNQVDVVGLAERCVLLT